MDITTVKKPIDPIISKKTCEDNITGFDIKTINLGVIL
ncbi:MAG: hypothetical protein ACJAUD_000596 [Crocinitomicaceae bacterium]|jgi:hypothetical protein